MNEYGMTPIQRVEPESSSANIRQAQNQPVAATCKPEEAAAQPTAAAPEPEKKQASLPITSTADVFLKFQVNDKTKDVTIYVVDRASKRIVRSIPPDEMNKLKAGDLLEMLA